MPFARGVLGLFDSIPDRIEVSGQEPTWRVTAGSYEAAVAFAEEAFGEAVVVAREDRSRWWPRVTLTVTTDPALAGTAPAPGTLADGDPQPQPQRQPQPQPQPQQEAAPQEIATLEAMFAYQEEVRALRSSVPRQRRR
jgi:hypothetical protein